MKKIEQCDYTSWEFSDKAMLIVKGNKEIVDKIHKFITNLEQNDTSCFGLLEQDYDSQQPREEN